MIIYIDNTKESTKSILETINKYCKVNIQISFAFLYTKNKTKEKDIEASIPYKIVSQNLKIFSN